MGASFGSNTHRFQCVAPLGAPSRRPYGAGPRFLRSASACLVAPSTLAPFGRPCLRASGKPHGPPSASSSRGVIVPPGGTPAPPECRRSVHLLPAGAASDPTFITPHESALGGSDAAIINPPQRARISSHDIVIIVLVVAAVRLPSPPSHGCVRALRIRRRCSWR